MDYLSFRNTKNNRQGFCMLPHINYPILSVLHYSLKRTFLIYGGFLILYNMFGWLGNMFVMFGLLVARQLVLALGERYFGFIGLIDGVVIALCDFQIIFGNTQREKEMSI